MIEIGTHFSGIGAFEQALKELDISYHSKFACDINKYARKTFIYNHGTEEDIQLLNHPDVKFCDDVYYRYIHSKDNRPTFSEYRKLLNIEEKTARLFSFYYPWNVNHVNHEDSAEGFYVTTPPCQSFSLSGKRGGENDRRGIMFYSSHEYIRKHKPRGFLFENVKGLLSDDKGNPKDDIGRTFRKWLDYLGGKSVNGNPIIFPHEESVPYHIYWTVLNAKDYGIPQNRERVFILGIRDDEDNDFHWPKTKHLELKLKDVLEKDIDQKYFLSETLISGLVLHREKQESKGNGFGFGLQNPDGVSKTIRKGVHKCGADDNYIAVKSATSKGFREIKDGSCPTIPARAREDGSGQPVVQIDYDIRRLTPRECIRLMGFPDSFQLPCSDTQTYKQAGNSIVVQVLMEIVSKIKFICQSN